MQILVIATVPEGTSMEQLSPHLAAEERLSWQYYNQGKLRSFFGRDPVTDALGAIFVFEVESMAEVKELTAAYPLSKAGLVSFVFHTLEPFANFELLFKPEPQEASL